MRQELLFTILLFLGSARLPAFAQAQVLNAPVRAIEATGKVAVETLKTAGEAAKTAATSVRSVAILEAPAVFRNAAPSVAVVPSSREVALDVTSEAVRTFRSDSVTDTSKRQTIDLSRESIPDSLQNSRINTIADADRARRLDALAETIRARRENSNMERGNPLGFEIRLPSIETSRRDFQERELREIERRLRAVESEARETGRRRRAVH